MASAAVFDTATPEMKISADDSDNENNMNKLV